MWICKMTTRYVGRVTGIPRCNRVECLYLKLSKMKCLYGTYWWILSTFTLNTHACTHTDRHTEVSKTTGMMRVRDKNNLHFLKSNCYKNYLTQTTTIRELYLEKQTLNTLENLLTTQLTWPQVSCLGILDADFKLHNFICIVSHVLLHSQDMTTLQIAMYTD